MDFISKINTFLEESQKKDQKPLIVLLGPTASGKTGLSLHLAKEFNGEIISADSRQVYKKMDIGTDKASQKDMAGVPHHLIDVANPDEEFTLAHYKTFTNTAIYSIHLKGKVPFLVGGTGLYISAVTQNFDVPKIAPNYEFRKKIEEEIEEKGADSVYERLKKLDPASAAKIHPNNHRYLIRALEIVHETKKPRQDQKGEPPYNVLKIGIEWDREDLYQKINIRVEEQVVNGLLAETEKLMEKYSRKLPSMSGLGYKQMAQFLDKEITYQKALDLLKKETRNYAKRQLTWFRRDQEIVWVPRKEVEKYLKDNN